MRERLGNSAAAVQCAAQRCVGPCALVFEPVYRGSRHGPICGDKVGIMRGKRRNMITDRLNVATQQRSRKGTEPAVEAVVQSSLHQRREQRARRVDSRAFKSLRGIGNQRHEMVRRVAERRVIKRAALFRNFDRNTAEQADDPPGLHGCIDA